MTKNQIIESLFTGKNFRDCIKKMEPEHLREDLMQEVILRICELPEEKIIGMHERKELEFYTVRVIINMCRNPRDPFSKRFRQFHFHFDDQHLNIECSQATETEERELREIIEDMAIEEVDKLYWYDRDVLKLYMKLGTLRAVSEKTRIPHTSIFHTVKKTAASIRGKINRSQMLSQQELNHLNLINTKEYLNA